MPVAWSDGLSVGIAEIDGQHRKLLGLMNGLEAALGHGRDAAALDRIARQMADYARYHFAAEERRMDYALYPDAAAHKAEHAEFRAEAESLLAAGRPGPALDFLRGWLLTHIQGTDRKLGAFLQGM